MKKIALKFKQHTSIREFIGALLVMLLIAGSASFVFNGLVNLGNSVRIHILNKSHADTFFVYNNVKPTKDWFHVGDYPSFEFTKEFFVSGPIVGKNILRCEGFRSGTFIADGYVEDDILNIVHTGKPFVFGGDLPQFPTSCYLRSIITLCDEETNVCKTQTTESEYFNFINDN